MFMDQEDSKCFHRPFLLAHASLLSCPNFATTEVFLPMATRTSYTTIMLTLRSDMQMVTSCSAIIRSNGLLVGHLFSLRLSCSVIHQLSVAKAPHGIAAGHAISPRFVGAGGIGSCRKDMT